MKTFTLVERQDAMNQVMTPRRFLSLLVPAPGNPAGRRPVILMLGLAGIILGILGMHVLGASHQAPDTAGLSATSAHQAVSHDHGPPVMATDGTVGGEADSTCYGPCNGEHHLMAAMCVLMVIVLAVLWFLPKRWFIIPGKGLRAPPVMPAPANRLPWAPSLIELSISRT